MLWTIFVILLILWLLGVVTTYTLGGFIHLLLCGGARGVAYTTYIGPQAGYLTTREPAITLR